MYSTRFSKKQPPSNFYVYFYLRNDGTPYYCGKGKTGRAWAKNHGSILVPIDMARIVIVAHRLSETESHLLEIRLIKQFGRKDLGTGILRNMTNGGDGTSGRITTLVTKSRISKVKLGKPNKGAGWNKGIKYDEEFKQRMDMTGLEKGHGWNKGLRLSDTHRENLRKAWEKRRTATNDK